MPDSHRGVTDRRMSKKTNLEKIEALPAAERLIRAQEKTDALWQHIVALLQTHANNRVVNYTDRLLAQTGKSLATHALNDMRRAVMATELMRLCALWDKPSLDRCSIPTILALVNRPEILRPHIRELLRTRWRDSFNARWLGPADLNDEFLIQVRRGMAVRSVRQRTASIRMLLRHGIGLGNAAARSGRLRRMRGYRDQVLAHNLDTVPLNEAAGPTRRFRYGDERRLLATTRRVAEALSLLLNRTHVDYDESLKLATRNAGYLWDGCTINALR